MILKSMLAASGALLLTAGAASAVTISNQSKEAITVGIDAGNAENVEKIAAGASHDAKGFCPTGCGLTGPWGYSYLSSAGEKVTYDGDTLRGNGGQSRSDS